MLEQLLSLLVATTFNLIFGFPSIGDKMSGSHWSVLITSDFKYFSAILYNYPYALQMTIAHTAKMPRSLYDSDHTEDTQLGRRNSLEVDYNALEV